jgi:predicted nucleic acid-binding protein
MLVYVESNFILELALEQEEVRPAKEILRLAESRKLEFVFPIFALIECFQKIIRNGEERQKLYNEQLHKQLEQLRRSELHKLFLPNFQSASLDLLEIKKIERKSLEATTTQLLSASRSIDINPMVFEQAIKKYQSKGLELDDALIYAAIINDIQQQAQNEAKIFISRDTRAFGKRSIYSGEIESELKLYNCTYIPRFEDALKRIESLLSQNEQESPN